MIPSGAKPWSETAAGTDSGAAATHAAETNKYHFVTSISGHIDADTVVTIKDGSTIVWESKIDVSVEGWQIVTPSGLHIPITGGAACSGNIAASSADCQININGYTL
mgnify:CR=1 FL=1